MGSLRLALGTAGEPDSPRFDKGTVEGPSIDRAVRTGLEWDGA